MVFGRGIEGDGVEPQANATRCLAAGYRGYQSHGRGTPIGVG